MSTPNYIPDMNRFALAGPPQWFCERLWAYDPSLVVVPSRQGWFYRLAQRRKLQLVDKIAFDALKEQADTAMLMSYNLVPVTTILATVNWDNPVIFEELTRRAPWRMGGAEKYTALVEQQDRDDETRKQAEVDNMTTVLAKDAWGLYNKAIGTRTHMWVPKTAPKQALTAAAPGIRIAPVKAPYKPDTYVTFKGGKG